MTNPDYEDPDVEERWCSEERSIVADYLRSQRVEHGRIGEWPAWHVVPCASVWAVESLARPEWIGWWVITGDLPTDYISSSEVESPQHPRRAMRAFAHGWLTMVEAWKAGIETNNSRIAGPDSREELSPLLESRARILNEWADDDSLWTEYD